MCENCYREMGSPRMVTPAVEALVPLIRKADASANSNVLHLILDDWNLDDQFIRDALNRRLSNLQKNVCQRLLKMSVAERATAMALAQDIIVG